MPARGGWAGGAPGGRNARARRRRRRRHRGRPDRRHGVTDRRSADRRSGGG